MVASPTSAPKPDDTALAITFQAEANDPIFDEAIQEQALPNEILVSVFEFLKVDEQLKTLANAAQVNKTTYDLVIPMLYQNLRFTTSNKDKLLYGSTPSVGAEDHGKSNLNVQY